MRVIGQCCFLLLWNLSQGSIAPPTALTISSRANSSFFNHVHVRGGSNLEANVDVDVAVANEEKDDGVESFNGESDKSEEEDIISDSEEVEEQSGLAHDNDRVDINNCSSSDSEETELRPQDSTDTIESDNENQGYAESETSEAEEDDSSSVDTKIDVQVVLQPQTILAFQSRASDLRTKGKTLHDEGSFDDAASTFHQAAIELESALTLMNQELEQEHTSTNISNDGVNSIEEQVSMQDLAEECATCRLHEALCHLKNGQYDLSVQSCTNVLMDGVQIIEVNTVEDEEEDVELHEKGEESEDEETCEDEPSLGRKATVTKKIVRIQPNGGGSTSTLPANKSIYGETQLSAAVRARAYHRRAKARLALEDSSGALEDSRSAAFLGDRNAVALYGRLMRESGASSSSELGGGERDSIFGRSNEAMGSNGLGSMSDLFSSASALDGLFSNPKDSSSTSGSMSSSLDMFSSLLQSKGSESHSEQSPLSGLSGLGGLSGLMSGANMMNPGGKDGLAKSVISSLTKRIEDEGTQTMICSYLNTVDASQITSLTSMAGFPLSESISKRIVTFCNNLTPKGIQKGVKWTHRIIYLGNIMRKAVQVVQKYKHLIVLFVLIAWIKSAILRPIVLKKAKKVVADKLVKEAMANTPLALVF